MGNQGITLHLADAHTAFTGSALCGLVCQQRLGACVAIVDLVFYHLLEPLVVDRTHEYIRLHLLARHSVVENFVTIRLKAHLKHSSLEVGDAIVHAERRSICERPEVDSKLVCCCFQELAHRHACRDAVGVEDEIGTHTLCSEGHVLFVHNLPHGSLLAVARRHLVSHHGNPVLHDADLDALERDGPVPSSHQNRVGIHGIHASDLSALRLYRHILVASDRSRRRGLGCDHSDKDRIVIHKRVHLDDTVVVQHLVIKALLALHVLLERIRNLRVCLKSYVQHLLRVVVAVVIHRLIHPALQRRSVHKDRILLVVAAIHRDCDECVLAVGHASSSTHHLLIEPRLRNRLLGQTEELSDRVEPLHVVCVIPRGC